MPRSKGVSRKHKAGTGNKQSHCLPRIVKTENSNNGRCWRQEGEEGHLEKGGRDVGSHLRYEELKKSKKSKKREAEKLDMNKHQNAQIQAIQRGVECIIATLKR